LITAMGVVVAIVDSHSSVAVSRRQANDPASPNRQIYAAGIVEGATQDINLRFEQLGRLREVLVTEAQSVKAGDVLVRLDCERQQQQVALASSRLQLAKAELERLQNGARAEEREEAAALAGVAKARLDQAVRNLKLNQQLRRERAVTQQETDDQQSLVDTCRSEWEAARARVKQIEAPARADELRGAEARVSAAEAELKLAGIELSKTALRAPCRGRVLAIHGEPGELSGPTAPLPLVVLSDTSAIRVRAYVEELDAPIVKIGMLARVTADGLPNRSFTGRVRTISPQMANKSIHSDRPMELYDSKVREVVIELKDAPELVVGLRVDVELLTSAPGTGMRGN
jgi:HlyD family secretion protein